jgi:hypothetical protein
MYSEETRLPALVVPDEYMNRMPMTIKMDIAMTMLQSIDFN